MNMTMSGREKKGLEIAKLNLIHRINAHTYKVQSQSNNGEYKVSNNEKDWTCSCPDHTYRGIKCKHIYATILSNELRKKVETKRIEPLTNITNCVFCSSPNIVKDGIRHNKCGDIQIFYCKQCNHYFSFNIGFKRVKHNPQAITSAMLSTTDCISGVWKAPLTWSGMVR